MMVDCWREGGTGKPNEEGVEDTNWIFIYIGIPDVQDQEKDTAHVYHLAKLSPCVEAQLKIAEKRVKIIV